LRKFVRRYRGPVLAGSIIAFLLVAGIVGTTIGLVRATWAEDRAMASAIEADKQRRQAVTSAHDAEAQRERAEANLGKALSAIERMLERVGSERMANIPHLEHMRRQLLEDALRFHEKSFKEEDDRPALRLRRARSHKLVGDIHFFLDRHDEAKRQYVAALELLQELEHADGPKPDVLFETAIVRHRFANVLDEKRRLTDAERELRLALSVLTKLLLQIVQERGDMSKFRRDLANTCQKLADLLDSRGQSKEADTLFAESHALFQELVAKHPDVPEFQMRARMTAIKMDMRKGRHAQAAKGAQELARAHPQQLVVVYNAACLLARCVQVAERDADLSAEERKSAAQHYGDDALKLLRDAGKKGFTTAAQLKMAPDFASLRLRPDFQKLLAELEKKP